MSDTGTPAEETAPPEPELLHGAPVTWSHGQQVVHPSLATYLEVIGDLIDDGFEFLCDLTAVDHLGHMGRVLPDGVEPERFEVVVNLLSMARRSRIRVRVQVPVEEPVVPSLYQTFPGVDAMEREVYDLLGIEFDGHPDLTRILMPEDWQGHPLRKDHAIGAIPVQFKHPAPAR